MLILEKVQFMEISIFLESINYFPYLFAIIAIATTTTITGSQGILIIIQPISLTNQAKPKISKRVAKTGNFVLAMI